MIAKIVVSGQSRAEAAERLAFSCDTVLTLPVRNNAGFLASLARHPRFLSGDVETGFISDNLDELVIGSAASDALLETAALNIFLAEGGTYAALSLKEYAEEGDGPWSDLLGFRSNASANQKAWLLVDGELRETQFGTAERGSAGQGSLIERGDDQTIIVDRGWPHVFSVARVDGLHGGAAASGTILSPMPGRIIAVDVAAGDAVTKGQKLVTLEAMKMEHSLTAPFDGTVAELHAEAGGQVSEGMLLVRVEASAP